MPFLYFPSVGQILKKKDKASLTSNSRSLKMNENKQAPHWENGLSGFQSGCWLISMKYSSAEQRVCQSFTRKRSAQVSEAAITGGLSCPQPITGGPASVQWWQGLVGQAAEREFLIGHTEQMRVRSEEEGPPFLGPVIKFKPINTVSERPSNQGGSGFGRYRKYGSLGFCLGSPTHPQEQLCHSSLRELGLWWSHGLLGLKSQSKTVAGAVNCRPGPRTVLAEQWVNIELMVSYHTSH